MSFYYIAPFIPVIIAVILFVRWCRKENERVINSVNDAFDKAQSQTLLDPDDIPGQEMDFLYSERPFIEGY